MDGLPSLPTPPGAQQPAATPLAGFVPGQQAAGPARPPGRPTEDPIRQEERQMEHQRRRRLDNVVPKRATDDKFVIYRRGPNGTMLPGSRPVVTVLASDIELAKAEKGQDSEEYLRECLVTKLEAAGKEAVGTFICRIVDKRGSKVSSYPDFDIALTEEDANMPPLEDDDERDPQDGDGGEELDLDDIPTEELEAILASRRGGHRRPGLGDLAYPSPGAAPAPTPIDPLATDNLARRNRDEAKSEAQNSMALLMQVMQQAQQAQQQAQQQQLTMMLAMLEKSRGDSDKSGTEKAGTLTAVITALAPVLAKILEPKEQKTDPIIQAVMLKLLEKNSSDGSEGLIKMMSTSAEMQQRMLSSSAEGAMSLQAKLTNSVLAQMMEQLHKTRSSPDESPKGGESTLESIAKIAGPLLAGLTQQQAPALPAPAEEIAEATPVREAPVHVAIPAPPRARPTKMPPPTPTAAAQPPPAAPGRPLRQRGPEDRIRQALDAVLRLRIGKIPAVQRWGVVEWISKNAPAPVLAAVDAGDEPKFLEASMSAIITSPTLVQWISVEENRAFLRDILDDVRRTRAGQVTDAYAGDKVAALEKLLAAGVAPTQPAPAPTQPATPAPPIEAAPPAPAATAESPATPAAG